MSDIASGKDISCAVRYQLTYGPLTVRGPQVGDHCCPQLTGLNVESSINFILQCTDVTRFAKFVNTYVQANFSVKWICRSKKFCAESKSTNSGGLCAGCKAIVRMISSLIKTANETETEIIDAVKNLCKILSPLEIQAKVVGADV